MIKIGYKAIKKIAFGVGYLCLCLIFFVGCDQNDLSPETIGHSEKSLLQTQKTPKISLDAKTIRLLSETVTLDTYETPAKSLMPWYKYREFQPVLLLYSNDPLLQSTTPHIQKALLKELSSGNIDALRVDRSNPVILPKMSVYAALEAGLISEVYWVMPTNVQISELSIEAFRNQMTQLGAMSTEEAQRVTLHDGVFTGSLRGHPFHAVHPQADLSINKPILLHFDLSYLSPLYKSEIKTPLFPIIYDTLRQLRAQKLQLLFASFSYSQITGDIPLGSRFVGDILSTLFDNPALLDEKLPSEWVQRANALYLPELFNPSEGIMTLLRLVEKDPENASHYYALYSLSREVSSARHMSLDYLQKAVTLDQVYALEYLSLAPLAREKGRPEEAVRVLHLAHKALPDNPFVTIELIQALISQNQPETAISLIQKLQNLTWSEVFYPNMPAFLGDLLTTAEKLSSP